MHVPFHSSGDLLLDRRLRYAEDLLAQDDAAGAADLLTQTLERAPCWAPAWAALAATEEKRGLVDAAERAYVRLDEVDETGLFGARLHLARLHGAAPEAMPSAYVAALFDGYAARFERHLVCDLAYRGPALIMNALAGSCDTRRFGQALDLGCGTGLMGAAVRAWVDALDGIDISAAMVARAGQTGLYRSVAVDDIGATLRRAPAGAYDLILAADVFVYLGPLGPILTEAARVLAPRGMMAFTVQTSDIEDVMLGGDLRFAHSARHVEAGLRAAGFDALRLQEAWARRENGMAVPGLVVTACRP